MKNVTFGMILLFFVGVIVALSLMPAIAQNESYLTDTTDIVNSTFVAANNTHYYLTGFKSIASPVIYNNTADVVIGAGNYTITNNVIHDGNEEVRISVNYSSAVYAGDGWNISGTAQPDTYATSSGARSMASLITLMAALAIVGFGVWALGRSSGWLGK